MKWFKIGNHRQSAAIFSKREIIHQCPIVPGTNLIFHQFLPVKVSHSIKSNGLIQHELDVVEMWRSRNGWLAEERQSASEENSDKGNEDLIQKSKKVLQAQR